MSIRKPQKIIRTMDRLHLLHRKVSLGGACTYLPRVDRVYGYEGGSLLPGPLAESPASYLQCNISDLDQRQLSSIHRHASPVLTEYGHPVRSEQLATGGVISASQVVQVMIAPIRLPVAGQSLVFLTCDHLTLMRDCLDVVFILMA